MKSQKIIKKVNGDDLFYFDKHTKTYDEWIAREILMDTYPNEFSDLVVKDIPDLQDEKNEIGVEVTNVDSYWSGKEAQQLHNQIKKSKDIEEICQLKQRIEKLHTDYFDLGNDITGVGFEAYIENENMFIDTISKKIEKLNKKYDNNKFVYEHMQRYDLFIQIPYFNNSNNTLKNLIETAIQAQSKYTRKYEYLYIYSEWGKIFRCNLTKKEFDVTTIPRDKLEKIYEVVKKKVSLNIDY